MHVLGHSFSQRRKSNTKRPRDLKIRKVSFSGCSLSSAGSLSSASSTSTARTHIADMPNSGSHPAGLDPLSLNPTFQPPPRLFERPFIVEGLKEDDHMAPTFWDDSEDEEDVTEKSICEKLPLGMELPPHTSPMDHTGHDRQEAQDYFHNALIKRSTLPRSHWSASTIQTIDSVTPSNATPASTLDEDTDDDASVLEMPPLSRRSSNLSRALNFSHKRNTVPKRPPMKAMDSVDNFIKRGGWKRRGIVFHGEDMDNK